MDSTTKTDIEIEKNDAEINENMMMPKSNDIEMTLATKVVFSSLSTS